MAKTKTKNNSKQKDILRSTSAPLVKSSPKKSQKSIEDLLTEAAELLEQSQPELALPLAEEALQRLEDERRQRDSSQVQDEIDIEELLLLAAQGRPTLPPALVLNAEILVALGDVDPARRNFTLATQIDKDGALISAEPWLWLAQLCEEGGRESIRYFEQACEVLRNEIEVLEDAVNEMTNNPDGEAGTRRVLDEKKSKLADALCAMAEVYMTDLSWETDAEARCETLVTEAVAVCPDDLSAGVLQTLASVRISQERFDEARTALKRSLDIWYKAIPSPEESVANGTSDAEPAPEDDLRKPDFATRVSLTRLLMEVQLEQLALSVLEGLVREDDQSVECWYLGGWCQVLIAQKPDVASETKLKSQRTARTWLENCLRLYRIQDYDDDRLRDHANELVNGLKVELAADGEMDEDGDDGWEDVDEQDDGDDEDEDVDLEIEDDVNGHAASKTSDGDVEMT
ncbi:hypothetical protein H2200_008021 [Cladophialophora chaetospira]|uniref:TPR domain-containing protein n=1 Tax=Cladophialophora chaetospira TaxID=386627 RepID=A0AA38X6V6_9EURO|nr:hypothetical protein H2200_008021 [Cladophialophora chaetospira]